MVIAANTRCQELFVSTKIKELQITTVNIELANQKYLSYFRIDAVGAGIEPTPRGLWALWTNHYPTQQKWTISINRPLH